MATRKKNPTIYTGRVGARMKPRAHSARPKRTWPRMTRWSLGGPLEGDHSCTPGIAASLVITCRGMTGYYAGGVWHEVEAANKSVVRKQNVHAA